MTDDTPRATPPGASDSPASRKPRSLLDVPEAQREPMSRDVSGVFIQMSFADRESEDMLIAKAWEDLGGKSPQTTILVGRLAKAVPDISVRVPTLLFVSYLCSSPARCVLWAYTLAVLTRELGHAVQIGDLAWRFPNGFPTDEGCLGIWDAQKGSRGNRLDFAENWHAPILGDAA